MQPSLATYAEYYRIGILTGLLQPAAARDWATSVIQRMDEPPVEVIEISWSRDLHDLEAGLAAMPGQRNAQLAGSWLLSLLGQQCNAPGADLTKCAQQAIRITREARLGDSTYYELDVLEDELFNAHTTPGAAIDPVAGRLRRLLEQFPSLPSQGEA